MKKNLIGMLAPALLLLGIMVFVSKIYALEEIMCREVINRETLSLDLSPNYIASEEPKSYSIAHYLKTKPEMPQPSTKPKTKLAVADEQKITQQKQTKQAIKPPVVLTSPEELNPIFEKYSIKYGISSATLRIIANCESGFNPGALSKNGLYGGLFQYSTSTWISTRKTMGLDQNPELRFNTEEAIKTTAYKISQQGVGAWPHCGKIALATK